jgi:hypothetical protein
MTRRSAECGPVLSSENCLCAFSTHNQKKNRPLQARMAGQTPACPAEGELVTCPACLDQHPLIYEDEQPTATSWGYVECDWEYVLGVVEGKVLADAPLQINEH